MRRSRIWMVLAGVCMLGGLFGASGRAADDVVSVREVLHESRERLGAQQYGEALDLARRAVSLDPAYPAAWAQLGRVQMLREEYEEAEEAFDTALDLGVSEPIEIREWQFLMWMETGKRHRIRTQWMALPDEEIELISPSSVQRMLQTAWAGGDTNMVTLLASRWAQTAPREGLQQAAHAVCELAVAPAPGKATVAGLAPTNAVQSNLTALAWSVLGDRHLQARAPRPAVEAYERAVTLRPDWLQARVNLGWAYRHNREPLRAARTWVETAEAADAPPASWWFWASEAYLDGGETGKALATLDRVLESAPDHRRGLILKTRLLLDTEGRAAADAFLQAVDTDDVAYIQGLARALHAGEKENDREAIDILEALHADHPDDERVRRHLIRALANRAGRVKEVDKRIELLRRQVELDPSRTAAWRDLGWSYWVKERPEAAIEAWDTALRDQELAARHDTMAQVLALLVENHETDRALELFRTWAPALSWYEFGSLLVEKNRLVAAMPFLQRAWERDDDPARAGLYLAYARALNAHCGQSTRYVERWVQERLAEAPLLEIDVFLEIAYLCDEEPSLLPLVDRVDEILQERPDYVSRVTDILQGFADYLFEGRRFARAYTLYRRVLERDPSRSLWVKTIELAERLNRPDEARTVLERALEKDLPQAAELRLQGKRALWDEDDDTAIERFAASLAADPEQPFLRAQLFDLLIDADRFEAAAREAAWFERQVELGREEFRSELAHMLSRLGNLSEALNIWYMAHYTSPEVTYYGLETAETLKKLCQPGEARTILEELADLNPNEKVYYSLAELESALANREAAFDWATLGIQTHPSILLYRLRSELAEYLEDWETTLADSRAYLEQDPGYVPMARAVGRAYLGMEQWTNAQHTYEDLLARNPEFFPALLRLRELASRREAFQEALDYADALVDQRPWDIETIRRHAISLAEDEQFRPAIRELADVSEPHPSQAVPVLAYRNVTACDYPGFNSVKQVADHVQAITSNGFSFLHIGEDVDPDAREKRVVLVLVEPESSAIPDLDTLLKEHDIRAVLAGEPSYLRFQFGTGEGGLAYREILQSPRWQIAGSGPPDDERRPVNAEGVRGNPLTHRLYEEGRRETLDEMRDRVRNALAAAAEQLPGEGPKILFYPSGDYGHFSLDTEPDSLEVLHEAAEEFFDYALFLDDSGFMGPERDPLRLPAKSVAPYWGATNVVAHISEGNPLIRAKLELAKVLYWHRQHVRANRWFREVRDLGADPLQVEFNWGANAYQQGDLPSALEHLRNARDLAPDDEKIQDALDRAENKKRLQLEVDARGWEDSDERTFERDGARAHGFVSDHLRLGLFGDYNRWTRDGLGVEEGIRTGGDLLWFYFPQQWLRGELWWMDFDNPEIDDHLGGRANVHLPNRPFSGYVELEWWRDQVETIEAVRDEILFDQFGLYTYSRALDLWDVYANGFAILRTDENDTYMVNGRIVRRLQEWPYLGAGYRFRFADSDRDPDEYYAPEELQKHQLYAALRGTYRLLHYTTSGEAGYAREGDGDWKFVWGARLNADLRLTRRLSLLGSVSHFETPDYERDTWRVALQVRF